MAAVEVMEAVISSGHEAAIAVGEIFDFHCVQSFKRCYEGVDYDTVTRVIIDFGNTRYMDSSALGMLLNVKAYANNRGAEIVLKNTNLQINKILSIARFDKLFEIE